MADETTRTAIETALRYYACNLFGGPIIVDPAIKYFDRVTPLRPFVSQIPTVTPEELTHTNQSECSPAQTASTNDSTRWSGSADARPAFPPEEQKLREEVASLKRQLARVVEQRNQERNGRESAESYYQAVRDVVQNDRNTVRDNVADLVKQIIEEKDRCEAFGQDRSSVVEHARQTLRAQGFCGFGEKLGEGLDRLIAAHANEKDRAALANGYDSYTGAQINAVIGALDVSGVFQADGKPHTGATAAQAVKHLAADRNCLVHSRNYWKQQLKAALDAIQKLVAERDDARKQLQEQPHDSKSIILGGVRDSLRRKGKLLADNRVIVSVEAVLDELADFQASADILNKVRQVLNDAGKLIDPTQVIGSVEAVLAELTKTKEREDAQADPPAPKPGKGQKSETQRASLNAFCVDVVGCGSEDKSFNGILEHLEKEWRELEADRDQASRDEERATRECQDARAALADLQRQVRDGQDAKAQLKDLLEILNGGAPELRAAANQLRQGVLTDHSPQIGSLLNAYLDRVYRFTERYRGLDGVDQPARLVHDPIHAALTQAPVAFEHQREAEPLKVIGVTP